MHYYSVFKDPRLPEAKAKVTARRIRCQLASIRVRQIFRRHGCLSVFVLISRTVTTELARDNRNSKLTSAAADTMPQPLGNFKSRIRNYQQSSFTEDSRAALSQHSDGQFAGTRTAEHPRLSRYGAPFRQRRIVQNRVGNQGPCMHTECNAVARISCGDQNCGIRWISSDQGHRLVRERDRSGPS